MRVSASPEKAEEFELMGVATPTTWFSLPDSCVRAWI